jgi:DNA-directed RNA polymerase alpha subunit
MTEYHTTELEKEEKYALNCYIQSLCLSVRATNVLLLNCASLDDITQLNQTTLLTFQNCGRKTVQEILDFLDIVCSRNVAEPSLSPQEKLALPPEESSLSLLPLFSSETLEDVTVDQLHPDYRVYTKLVDLFLSERTAEILNALGMDTIGEVMLTPQAHLFDQQNFRNPNLRELKDIIRSLCLSGKQKEKLASPPKDSSLSILPLFSSKLLGGLSVDELHIDYHSSIKLVDLVIPVRTANVLHDLGKETIGEVMLTPGSYLLKQQNFGRTSLLELKNLVRSLCLSDTKEDDPNSVDYSSYEEMVASFIGQCMKSERDQKLFMRRLCFTNGKVPILEDLGQQFHITRERARQILKKGMDKLRVKVNIDKLDLFWKKVDQLVVHGGGLIKLGTLSTVLQDEFDWPTSPYPPALGEFLLLKQIDATLKAPSDLLKVECDCLTCDIPGQQIKALDFDSSESFHVQVVAAKISESCQTKCPWNKPVETFHPAFIERLVDQSNGFVVLHDNVILPHERWLGKYSKNIENVACHVLKTHGEPMHFREIANGIRRKNRNLRKITDRYVHNAIMRYKTIEIIGRGTYGLKSWGLGGYRSVSTAIEEFIDEKGFPQRRQNIIQHLTGEFTEQNITAALTKETRFISIGDGFYDRPLNWKQRSCQELIKPLPESVAELAHYLVSRNNTSYKLVLAFIFIRSMDKGGAIYLYNLRDKFYNFYLSRHKKKLVVEVDTTVMSRIDELSPAEVKSKACKEPLKSFLNTEYFQKFSQNGAKLRLVDSLASDLRQKAKRDTLLITLLKAINEYFLEISPTIAAVSVPGDTSRHEVTEPVQELQCSDPEDAPTQQTLTINIKKKGRSKIRL